MEFLFYHVDNLDIVGPIGSASAQKTEHSGGLKYFLIFWSEKGDSQENGQENVCGDSEGNLWGYLKGKKTPE
jgi:hypothetical protein